MQKYAIINTCGHEECGQREPDPYGGYYLASEVDAVLKRQAEAAISGMDAAKAISSGQLQQAHRLRAESSPEALESERAANAILTARVAELESQVVTLERSNLRLRQKLDRRG